MRTERGGGGPRLRERVFHGGHGRDFVLTASRACLALDVLHFICSEVPNCYLWCPNGPPSIAQLAERSTVVDTIIEWPPVLSVRGKRRFFFVVFCSPVVLQQGIGPGFTRHGPLIEIGEQPTRGRASALRMMHCDGNTRTWFGVSVFVPFRSPSVCYQGISFQPKE